MKKLFILFTCEHASNAIPPKYKSLFIKKDEILSSHRGYDHGTKQMTKTLAKAFKAPAVYGKFSRLLIDLNRSPKHKTLFSEMTRGLSVKEKEQIRLKYHKPHWDEIRELIAAKIKKGHRVLHIGVHSFTPFLFNELRNAEIGILYHACRKSEAAFAKNWQRALLCEADFRVRRNYPYNGKMDGLSTGLRKIFSEQDYLGFEIEVNHAVLKNAQQINTMENLLMKTLKEIT